jgi:VIT1/CCC1 family predicted Fe2+/Mn2+ transporter
MGIDKTEALLKKYDFNFQRENKELTIKMDFAQRMTIDFSDTEKIIIKDKLVDWNFLTGMIEMSIKGSILYNFIGAIIIIFLFVFLDLETEGLNPVFLFLVFMFWVLLWTMYYLMKYESLKQTLISWNEYKLE